jgi:hypothetical protein
MPNYSIHTITSAPINPKPALEQLQPTFGESGPNGDRPLLLSGRCVRFRRLFA